MEKTKQQQKLLEDKDAEKAKAEQATYDVGMKKIAQSLTAQFRDVARTFCAEVQNEAFNIAGVKADSDLRGADKVYYPPALRLTPSIAPPPPNPSSTSSVPKSTTTSTTKPASGKDEEQLTSTPVMELESEEVLK